MKIRCGAASLAFACFAALTLALCAAPVRAGVPNTINFQRRLTDTAGVPVPDTNSQILIFELYDAPTGGSRLWSEGLGGIVVRDGVFAVSLDFSKGYTGSNTLRTALAGTPYLEVKLSNGVPMTPRQQLAAVPYASLAQNVADGSISLANLAPGVLRFSNIGGSISLSQVPGGIVDEGEDLVGRQSDGGEDQRHRHQPRAVWHSGVGRESGSGSLRQCLEVNRKN